MEGLGKAEEIMLSIRKGEMRGYIPTAVVYKLHIYFLKGGTPVIRGVEELKTFIVEYFKVVELRLEDFIESEGDKILKENPDLAKRAPQHCRLYSDLNIKEAWATNSNRR